MLSLLGPIENLNENGYATVRDTKTVTIKANNVAKKPGFWNWQTIGLTVLMVVSVAGGFFAVVSLQGGGGGDTVNSPPSSPHPLPPQMPASPSPHNPSPDSPDMLSSFTEFTDWNSHVGLRREDNGSGWLTWPVSLQDCLRWCYDRPTCKVAYFLHGQDSNTPCASTEDGTNLYAHDAQGNAECHSWATYGDNEYTVSDDTNCMESTVRHFAKLFPLSE